LLAGNGTVNPFRYVGLFGYYLEFVNLYYVRARWLDAVVGVWLSNDPFGFRAGDFNVRRYVENAPTRLTDPSGAMHFYGCRTPGLGDVGNQACSALNTGKEYIKTLGSAELTHVSPVCVSRHGVVNRVSRCRLAI